MRHGPCHRCQSETVYSARLGAQRKYCDACRAALRREFDACPHRRAAKRARSLAYYHAHQFEARRSRSRSKEELLRDKIRACARAEAAERGVDVDVVLEQWGARK